MVQTFAQAWGIKPKRPEPEPKPAVKPEAKPEAPLAKPEPVLQPKVVEKPIEVKVPKVEVLKVEAVEVQKPEKERIVERIVEKQRDGEYVSVHYHKQLIYMLFIMHITSLVALLLVIFLKK